MKNLLQMMHLMLVTSILGLLTEKPCLLRKFDAGYVCVCTDDYCDTLKVPKLNSKNEWMLVTSTESGQRFNISVGEFKPLSSNNKPTNSTKTFFQINQNVMYQEIVGFGGSFSGAVSYILDNLSQNLRECIYRSYYSSDDGIGYAILRMPIAGCDFDLEPYAYNEFPENDTKLTNFTELHPKDVLRVRLIRELMNASQNNDIKVIGISWSPPRWMKQKAEWAGKNDNQLKTEYYATWADYHVKWLDLMQSAGMPMFAISTGNEPYFAHYTPFMGLSWQVSSLASWIVQYLGPALKNSNHSSLKIHTFDDNRDVLVPWMNELNASNAAAIDLISVIGVHGYFDKKTTPETTLDVVKDKYPDKLILYTEMCFGVTGPISSTGPTLGSWHHFEQLTDMLMELLMHNVNGYISWNLILDSHGGPNYIHNLVDAMIIASADFKEIYKQPLFYSAAHFMKFILPGSRRIETNASGDNLMYLSSLAFLRPDGKVAAILYNKSQQNVISLQIIDRLKGQLDIALKPKSLNSLIYSI